MALRAAAAVVGRVYDVARAAAWCVLRARWLSPVVASDGAMRCNVFVCNYRLCFDGFS